MSHYDAFGASPIVSFCFSSLLYQEIDCWEVRGQLYKIETI